MNKPIAIIFTTFLRNELAFQTIQSIQPYLSENLILLIGDQNETNKKLPKNLNWHYTCYYSLPFDCGLSYARNYLIHQAYLMNIPYVLVTADSIEFTHYYDFEPITNLMSSKGIIAKVGFNLNNRIPWEFNLDLKDSFILSISDEKIEHNSIDFKKVDLCRNFYLAKTEVLLDVPYDNELKLAEHEDHCWRLKQAGYETYYTDYISANYINNRPEEYKIMRKRLAEYKKILFKKYNLKSWVTYTPEVKEIFKEWRKSNEK